MAHEQIVPLGAAKRSVLGTEVSRIDHVSVEDLLRRRAFILAYDRTPPLASGVADASDLWRHREEAVQYHDVEESIVVDVREL